MDADRHVSTLVPGVDVQGASVEVRAPHDRRVIGTVEWTTTWRFASTGWPFTRLKQSGLGAGGIPYSSHDMQIDKMLVATMP